MYRTFEWILWLPRGIRDRAVRKLELEHGDIVLEVGAELTHIFLIWKQAVVQSGHVFGCRSLRKDAQPNAGIVRAQRLEKCHARLHGRIDYRAPWRLTLFYSVSPIPLCRIASGYWINIWSQLRAGGAGGNRRRQNDARHRWRLLHPLIIAEMKATVLGDPGSHDACADLKH